MADLRTEIEKIFNEMDKDLQDDKENSMTIYDCFDFQEKDKVTFIGALTTILKLFGLYYDEKREDDVFHLLAKPIMECNPTLAQIIVKKLCDKKFITLEYCEVIGDFIDKEWEKYIKSNPPTPLEEVAKDYPYLSKLMESFNKKND